MSISDAIKLLFLAPVPALVLWLFLGMKKRWLLVLPGLYTFVILTFLVAGMPEAPAEMQFPFLSDLSSYSIQLTFLVDPLRVSLAFLAVFFSILIQFFSLGYLEEKDNHGLFHFLISLFASAMVWLFLANSFFTLFLGWEMVGLCSYLLVQFWYTRTNVLASGLKVLMINKLGDVLLLSGLGLLVSFGLGGWVFSTLTFQPGAEVFMASTTGKVLSLFLLTAACIKSAQFPFSVWLKEAMSGPASVSALLHSATMVVAGVWLMTLVSPVLAAPILHVLLVLGCLTLILSSLAAIVSLDLKTTLAFSTMAQLGVMMVAVGLGNSQGALFHLFSHAYFKASLFLFCGALLVMASRSGLTAHKALHLPDLKGILAGKPLYRICFMVCCLALAGLPFTSGFISKENLIPQPWQNSGDVWVWLAYVSLQIGSALTAFYSMRMGFYLCLGRPSDNIQVSVPKLLGVPIVVLSAGAGFWLFGPNPFSTEGWLSDWWKVPGHTLMPEVLMALVGTVLAWRTARKQNWKVHTIPVIVRGVLLDFSYARNAGAFLWKAGLRLSTLNLRAEQTLFEKPLIAGSKFVLVSGYFAGFIDRFGIDALLDGLVALVSGLGAFLQEHTKRYIQFVVWFAVTILLVLIYLSYYK